jgi:hypothetical protein
MSPALLIVSAGLLAIGQAVAPNPLAQARLHYNAREYDQAIALARQAREVPLHANEAAVVLARAYLERYRDRPEEGGLVEAREALKSVDAAQLAPRDHIEYLVGLGETLYFEAETTSLEDRYGAAAHLFQLALDEAEVLTPDATDPLFEWWANALDRQGQFSPDPDRRAIYQRLLEGAEAHLRRHARSAMATYWLAAAARGVGDLDRAQGAATAGWIRAGEFGVAGAKLRLDLDNLVLSVILRERANRIAPEGDARQVYETLKAQWTALKEQWGGGRP